MKTRFFLRTLSIMPAYLACSILQHLAMAEESKTAAAPTADQANAKLSSVVFGGGCFWCVEAQYEMLKGVKSVVSGYAGGHVKNPTYEEVCGKKTGHAEVVRIDFDPKVISLREIIDLFWDAHDPTTPNRQGNDVGPQYRSIILYGNEEQKKVVEESRAAAQKIIKDPIVTEVVPLQTFYVAEDYHQDYFRKNPYQGYCNAVVRPKVVKFRGKLIDKKKLEAAFSADQ